MVLTSCQELWGDKGIIKSWWQVGIWLPKAESAVPDHSPTSISMISLSRSLVVWVTAFYWTSVFWEPHPCGQSMPLPTLRSYLQKDQVICPWSGYKNSSVEFVAHLLVVPKGLYPSVHQLFLPSLITPKIKNHPGKTVGSPYYFPTFQLAEWLWTKTEAIS